jgi:ribose transport system ATP-binding protein
MTSGAAMSSETAAAPGALDVEGVSKTYAGVTVLNDVHMSVDRGTVRALLGQNGSGKSTLIRILAGDVDPDPGAVVRVDGAPLRMGNPQRSRDAGLRFVHQNLCVIGSLSVMENIALTNGFVGGRAGSISWSAERRRSRSLLARFRLDLDVDAPLGRYRRVEHAMVAIARALEEDVGPIRVLVLDEPTASLPPPEVEQLFDVLRQVRDSGVAIVYVTHRMDEVFRIADGITILRDGSVRMTCATADTSPEAVAREMIGDGDLVKGDGTAGVAGTGAMISSPQQPPGRVPTARKTIFEVRGLRSSLLQGVSFSVAAGEVVGIAGLAGSGREEVGAAVVGAVPGSAELVRICDWVVEGALMPRTAIDHGVAYVRSCWQDGGAIKRMSIRENVTLASLESVSGLGWLAVARERRVADDWGRRLRIVMRSCDQVLAQLSGGNQQKVVIAKWMNASARVLLLDEPTAGVDVGAKEELHSLVRQFVEAGKGVVVASSDSVDFVGVCHRVIVLRNGKVVGELVGDAIDEGSIHRAIMGVDVGVAGDAKMTS